MANIQPHGFIKALLENKSTFSQMAMANNLEIFTYIHNAVQANMCTHRTKYCRLQQSPIMLLLANSYHKSNGNNTKIFAKNDIQMPYREPRAGDIRDSLANISKTQQLLGYQPQYSF